MSRTNLDGAALYFRKILGHQISGVPYFEKDPQADTVSDTPSDIIQLWLPMCFDPELREVACSHRGSGALDHQGDEVTATRSNRRA